MDFLNQIFTTTKEKRITVLLTSLLLSIILHLFYLPKGLVQAAQTTRAWIVTSGLNLGIIRVVGDALQEQSYSTDKRMLSQQLRCIGIAPWGYVLNRNTLVANNYEVGTKQNCCDFTSDHCVLCACVVLFSNYQIYFNQ